MLNIRPATAGDVKLILEFIRELAAYEREPQAVTHSEGISYKPPSGEIEMRLRVGRMGPNK